MCGRYYIASDDREMQSLLQGVLYLSELKLGEIFPTDHAPVILPQGELSGATWGFPRFDGNGQMINARSETVAEKRMFQAAFQNGRCLIPASLYFEWKSEGTKKQKYAFSLPEQSVLFLGGISKFDPKTGEHSFVILTREAASDIAFIHDRMPVILPQSEHDEWLHGKDGSKALESVLTQVAYRAI